MTGCVWLLQELIEAETTEVIGAGRIRWVAAMLWSAVVPAGRRLGRDEVDGRRPSTR